MLCSSDPFRPAGSARGLCSVLVVLILSVTCGCGSTSSPSGSSTQSSGSGGSGGSGGNSFKPRPFPGDFFIRLSPQAGNGYASAAAYDPMLKEVFVSDPNTNAVEVYSSADAHKVGEISVPGPAGLSFSPDFSELIVGTITPYLYTADPVALHLNRQIEIPVSFLSITQYQAMELPVMPFAMADGTIMIGLGTNSASSSGSYTIVERLVLYDPSSGTFVPESPSSGAIIANPARSQDGTSLLVSAINNSTPTLFVYKSGGRGYVASAAVAFPLAGGISLAANQDGSQFAAVIGVLAPGLSTAQVNFWDAHLNPEGQYNNVSGASPGIFSRDGSRFYILLNTNRLVALNTQSASVAGYLGAIVGSSPTYGQLFDIDENLHLFGGSLFGGLFILNASQLSSSPPAALPDFPLPAAEGSLNVGPLSGGGQDMFSPAAAGPGGNDGIDPTMEAYFGSVPAPFDSVAASSTGSSSTYNFLTATLPTSSTLGPVSVVLTDASNDAVFLPDDFTYGPHLLRIGPNAVSPRGGDAVTVSAYGLGPIGGALLGSVSFGGTAVNVSSGIPNSSSSFYYPEQTVTLHVPAGTPGWADIGVSNPFGSDSLKRGLQYLSADEFVAGPAYEFAVYDPVRDRFYLTGNGNSVAVFDPQAQKFLSPLSSQAISSSATLFGEALTPDSTKLVVADPKDQLVIVFDLVAGTSSAVEVLLTIDPTITLTDPMPIEAASNNRAFVSLTPCVADPVREIDLTNLSVQARPDAGSSCATYVPYPEFGGASADGSTILFAGNAGLFGLEPPGPEYVWSYNANTDAFTGPLEIGDSPWIGGQPSVDGDGQIMALSQGSLNQRLLPLAPFQIGGLDSRLNETGSLLYSVDTSVVISDTHNGRPLLTVGLPSMNGVGPAVSSYRPLAIDPTGKKILVATLSGVSYFELSVVPLAVGTVSPKVGSAGTNVQIRGSGFVSGTTVQIGGQNANCTETNSETLSCSIPNLPSGAAPMSLSNPDGQTYTFENAFKLQ